MTLYFQMIIGQQQKCVVINILRYRYIKVSDGYYKEPLTLLLSVFVAL